MKSLYNVFTVYVNLCCYFCLYKSFFFYPFFSVWDDHNRRIFFTGVTTSYDTAISTSSTTFFLIFFLYFFI